MSRSMFGYILVTCVIIVMMQKDVVLAEHLLVLACPTFSHSRNLMDVVNDVTKTYGYKATVVTSRQIATSLKLVSNASIDIVISGALDKVDFKSAETKLAKDICYIKENGQMPSLSEQWDIVSTCDAFHNDITLLKQIKRRKFKLAIIDNMPLAECFTSFAYNLFIPYIYFGVLYDPVRMRIPFSPATTPFYFRFVVSDKMRFSERLQNVLTSITMELAPSYLISLTDIAKYTPHREKLTSNQLFSKASFHLVETDFLIDYPKPSLPHVAFVGGISTKPSEILSDHFQSFMDSSETGAVIVSFGSGLNGFQSDRMDTLIKAFKQRPDLHFIVKHGLLAHLEGNVMFSPWIPQNDLLGHDKTVAFFTHCGNNGQFEALYHGVPMIGFPLFADQYYNCERMKQRQYGLVLEFCSFDVENIETALISITTNKKYLYNIRNASHIFHGRSETPLQRASYWIDHVMRYGDTYIHSYCTDIPWYQYYLLDVFMVLTTLFFFIIYLLVQIFKCWRYVCSKSIDKHVRRKAKIH